MFNRFKFRLGSVPPPPTHDPHRPGPLSVRQQRQDASAPEDAKRLKPTPPDPQVVRLQAPGRGEASVNQAKPVPRGVEETYFTWVEPSL